MDSSVFPTGTSHKSRVSNITIRLCSPFLVQGVRCASWRPHNFPRQELDNFVLAADDAIVVGNQVTEGAAIAVIDLAELLNRFSYPIDVTGQLANLDGIVGADVFCAVKAMAKGGTIAHAFDQVFESGEGLLYPIESVVGVGHNGH
jgi:hypothetical protein